MIDEAQVSTRHKKKLAKIREDRQSDVNNSDEDSRGYLAPNIGENDDGNGQDRSTDTGSTGREERATRQPGTIGRSDSRVRPLDGENEYPTESTDRMVQRAEEESVSPPSEIDLQAERERKRELARQRQARYVERKREEERDASSSNASPLHVVRQPKQDDEPKFTLKNPFNNDAKNDDVKVFTKVEAEEQLEKLVFLYQRGSELLDDVLEIIVRDHEPIRIWALDEEEASMLANIQMEQAKKDKSAARVVRSMIKIYDKMFLLMLLGPRVKATGTHIKSHGGLSFR